MVVSAPHTEHFTALVKRSGEMARFACANNSAGTTGSDFDCGLRFISFPVPLFNMADVPPGNKLRTRSRRLRNLHNGSYFQCRPAPRALLAGGDARIFPLQIDLGRNRMSADGTMGHSLRVTLDECFHIVPLHSIGRKCPSNGCAKNVKIIKSFGWCRPDADADGGQSPGAG